MWKLFDSFGNKLTKICKHVKTINVDNFCHLTDTDGHDIDSTNYHKMMVWGSCLEPIGVNHKDIILIKKLTLSEYSNLELPKVCVFHRNPDNDNKSEYNIGYVFGRYRKGVDNLYDLLNDIFASSKYQKFKKDIRYVSDDYVLENLKIPKDIQNISLCMKLDDKCNFILYCVNSLDIFGVCDYSFPIPDKEIELIG